MPHSTSSGGFLNADRVIFRSASLLLKLFETICGGLCLGLISFYRLGAYDKIEFSVETFFFLATFAFFLTTFLLLVSSSVSSTTGSLLTKTLFELMYHLFAFVFYLAGSLSLLFHLSKYDKNYYPGYNGKMTASVLGIANSVLYLLSIFFSFRSFRAD